MPTFEEEALKRAQQMHSRVPPYKREERSAPENQIKAESREENAMPQADTPLKEKHMQGNEKQAGVLDFLMRDREQSLILLLLLLLYGENADPALLLALMYLLI